MPTSGTRPLRLGEQRERAAVEPGDDRHVDVAGAPAAALGEQHDRQPPALGELEQAVLLGVVAHALGAGQDRVVVGHRHARVALDVADAADEPVGGRAGDQLLARCGGAPGRRTAAARTRRRCPSSTRSARFSRAVRRPCSWRRATASGRPASSPTSWRSRTARRSARSPRVRGVLGVAGAGRRGRRRRVAARASAAAGPPRRRRRPPRPARATTPSISASTSCSIFIASSTTTGASRRRPARSRRVGERDDDAANGAMHAWSARSLPRRRSSPTGGAAPFPPSGIAQPCPGSTGMSPAEAAAVAERREALKEVLTQARACTRCPELAATRKTVVFGAGNADAELMFVGEAPGASEDEQGLPFVGPRREAARPAARGDRACSEQTCVICNVLKCRPPGNRDPQPIEIENCQEYLLRQVELIEPTVICTLGNFSTKLLRGDPTGITRLHGQPEVIDARLAGGAAVPDLPPGRGPLHAADARDAARGLRAAARAARAGRARAARREPAAVPEPRPGRRRPASRRRRSSPRPLRRSISTPARPSSWGCSRRVQSARYAQKSLHKKEFPGSRRISVASRS